MFIKNPLGVPVGGASNTLGVVDDGNFGDLGGYVFENFTDTASNRLICDDMLPLVDR